ncbi:MGDG synthase family glycosyltransferase [Falsibacillus pallidus]|uniref:MGDG synthase family glycosyltransferase n=1 Tax=Falsibacillus pallidus TaxID=493781 RepID=UPI003D98D8B9
MKKVLFLPLFQMQSGHHQVSETMMNLLKKRNPSAEYKKIEFFTYINESLGETVTKGYLTWINDFPKAYEWIYKKAGYSEEKKDKPKRTLEFFFLRKMEQLLEEEKPDLVVCTQAFSSYLVSRLKMYGRTQVAAINVYTDFFVNHFWGKEGIDLHFVPTADVKDYLVREHRLSPKQIQVTGIPIHSEFKRGQANVKNDQKQNQVLIAGGSSGLGDIVDLIPKEQIDQSISYLVLCGSNKKLYEELKAMELPHVKPLSYISSRKEMNDLYDKVDAIITKPGGVTISEVLYKEIPIFVYSSLPGQETINLDYLKKHGLVTELSKQSPIESQLKAVLENSEAIADYKESLQLYHDSKEQATHAEMYQSVIKMMDEVRNRSYRFAPEAKSTWYKVVGKYIKEKLLYN